MSQELLIWGGYAFIAIAIIASAVNIVVLSYMTKGAPYLQTTEQDIQKLLTILQRHPVKKIADIGSGDGRIVIALAKSGMEAHGYEINPLLVKKSRKNIQHAGIKHLATIHWKDLWKTDFSDYDAVTIFGVGFIMKRLEKKLQKELKPGAQIISFRFPLPTWPLKEQIDSIYLYKK